ncbi:MAG: hypothetical protein WCI11_15015 [Candidatus Methylumidiphilus sp.]
MKPHSLRRTVLCLSIAAAFSTFADDAFPASAAGKNWTGAAGDSLWSNGNNWDPLGTPAGGDAVFLQTVAPPTDQTVIYDLVSSPTLGSILVRGLEDGKFMELSQGSGTTLDTNALTVDGANNGNGTYRLLGPGAVLNSGTTVIGQDGLGAFYNDVGDHTSGPLVLGQNQGSSGSYSLSSNNSNLVPMTVNGDAIVGDAGTGYMSLTEARQNVTGNLILGQQSTGDGGYSLTGASSLSVGADLVVGDQGKGSFGHGLADNTVTGNLILGRQVNSDGTYTQSSGTLTTDTLTVGDNGTGTYDMSGGTLNVLHNDASVSTVTIGNQDGSVGTFNQDGGDVSVNHNISLGQHGGSVGNYNLNAGTLNVNGFITLSFEGIGTINQQAGTTNTVASDIYMGGTNGTYNLKGGDLLVKGDQGLIVGTFGTGTFNQTDGTNTSTYLSLGGATGSNGTYNLSNGSLQVTHDAVIGHGESLNNFGTGSVGTFQQTGGTSQVGGNLILGQTGVFLAGAGTYNLNGGSLAVTGSVALGAGGDTVSGTGTFNQDNSQGDSTHTVGGNLVLGQQIGSTGTYTLTDQLNSNAAPSLTVSGDTIIGQAGTGTFTQNGGAFSNTNGGFYVGGHGQGSDSGVGTYNLNSGTLNTGWQVVGEAGIGTFNQTGGENNAALMLLGNCGGCSYGGNTNSSGYYNLSGGTLNVAGEVSVSGFGYGEFNQSGGTANVGTTVSPSNLVLGTNEAKGGLRRARAITI